MGVAAARGAAASVLRETKDSRRPSAPRAARTSPPRGAAPTQMGPRSRWT